MTKPLFEVFRDALMRKPEGSRKEALDYFRKKMSADPAYLEMLARDYFERMSATYVARKVEHGFVFGRTDAAEARGEAIRRGRAESAARSPAMLAALQAKVCEVLLLDLVMPNGKKLRDSTGADCARAGGFYAEVSKHIKPTQVVDKHLTEANLQDIRSRYFQRNEKAAA